MNYIDMVIAIDEEIDCVRNEIKKLEKEYFDNRYSVDFRYPYRLEYKDSYSGYIKASDFKTYENAREFVKNNNIEGTYIITDMMLQMIEMFEKDFTNKNKKLTNRMESLYEVRSVFYSKLTDEEKSKIGTYRG